MFVALVGSDGVGKTTVSRHLAALAAGRGLRFAYVHWMPGLAEPPAAVPEPVGPPPAKRRSPARVRVVHRALSIVRLARNLGRFWLGYLMGMRRHLGDVRDERCLVVADRWIYNYLGQPTSVAYHGPHALARLAARLAPQPDLVAVLDVPAEVAVARKSELTVDEAREERQRWLRLHLPTPTVVIDGTDAPETVASNVLDALCTSTSRAAP